MKYYFPDAGVLPERDVLNQHRHFPTDRGIGKHWGFLLHTRLADWLVANPSSLGGQGIILELKEAKFGKRKYNEGAYPEGQWVLGGVDIVRGQCWASRMVPQIVHLKIPILHAYKMILFLLYGLVKLLKGFLSQT